MSQGMAPTPEQLERLHSAKAQKIEVAEPSKKKGKGQRPFVRVIVDLSLKTEVQQILYGVHWQYQKRILDILEIVTEPSTWNTVRKIALDIQSEQAETMRILVGQRITAHLAEDDKEHKDNGNNGKSE